MAYSRSDLDFPLSVIISYLIMSQEENTKETHEQGHEGHFVIPVYYYAGTFVALLFLTFFTVTLSRIDFGFLNIIIAMGVAVVKGSLVVAFFMGLRFDKGFNIFVLLSGFIFLSIFFVLTLSDTLTRGAVDKLEKYNFNINSPVKKIGSGHGQGDDHSKGAATDSRDKKHEEEHAEVDPKLELGMKLYKSKICFTCHTLDGSKLIGPSWKGIYGKMEKLADGSEELVDDAYIKKSILTPNANITAGYEPVMPDLSATLTNDEIEALIAVIKSLK